MSDQSFKTGMPRVLPSKLYFRIGEVASLVGVEPHVLRYWEREFRSIRPTKSAKGQRVYSRRDVENLMRVRDLLYAEGFTIAGAKKKLQRGEGAMETEPVEPVDGAPLREQLLAIRAEVEAFLGELEPPARS
jgi:DNA-binding transcriptional MerR regulator